MTRAALYPHHELRHPPHSPSAWTFFSESLAHLLRLSMLSVGGAITSAPEMQRYVGMLVTMVGILILSSTLALAAKRWSHAQRASGGVRAFVAVLAPLTIGLLLATGLVLAAPLQGARGAIALVIASAFVMWRWRPNPLWLIAAGALVGGLGGA